MMAAGLRAAKFVVASHVVASVLPLSGQSVHPEQ
jgi:hypothetical protein